MLKFYSFLARYKNATYIYSIKQTKTDIMTTTIATIENELRANNLPFTGSYSAISKMILSLVKDIKHFGVEMAMERSGLGKGPKRIALELAEKDTRKAVLRNGKTVLL